MEEGKKSAEEISGLGLRPIIAYRKNSREKRERVRFM